jgi:hypothetical protein
MEFAMVEEEGLGRERRREGGLGSGNGGRHASGRWKKMKRNRGLSSAKPKGEQEN